MYICPFIVIYSFRVSDCRLLGAVIITIIQKTYYVTVKELCFFNRIHRYNMEARKKMPRNLCCVKFTTVILLHMPLQCGLIE